MIYILFIVYIAKFDYNPEKKLYFLLNGSIHCPFIVFVLLYLQRS